LYDGPADKERHSERIWVQLDLGGRMKKAPFKKVRQKRKKEKKHLLKRCAKKEKKKKSTF
jgi:hypothetical protein